MFKTTILTLLCLACIASLAYSAEHTIERGETLSELVLEYHPELKGQGWEAIKDKCIEVANANGIKDINLIYAGSTISISVETYTPKSAGGGLMIISENTGSGSPADERPQIPESQEASRIKAEMNSLTDNYSKTITGLAGQLNQEGFSTSFDITLNITPFGTETLHLISEDITPIDYDFDAALFTVDSTNGTTSFFGISKENRFELQGEIEEVQEVLASEQLSEEIPKAVLVPPKKRAVTVVRYSSPPLFLGSVIAVMIYRKKEKRRMNWDFQKGFLSVFIVLFVAAFSFMAFLI